MRQTRTSPRPLKPAETAEGKRLRDADHGVPWRIWGPYVSERQ
jgi:hypothetical protein